MLGPGTPLDFGMARMLRQRHQARRAPPGPPWCGESCPGRPSVSAFMGDQHVHHHCWACGREILTRAEYSYDCHACEVSEGPAVVKRPDREFDEEFAATRSSPA